MAKLEKLEEEKDKLREDHNSILTKLKEELKRLRDENEADKKIASEKINSSATKILNLEDENKFLGNRKNLIEKEIKHLTIQIKELQNENEIMKITLNTQSESLKKNEVLIKGFRKQDMAIKDKQEKKGLYDQDNLNGITEDLKSENTKLQERYTEGKYILYLI